MDAKQFRAATALFFMCLAVLARGAHAGPLRDGRAMRTCTIVGTPGNDALIGAGGNDRIDGLGGNDIIFGGPGNDWIQGGLGRDTVYGGPGDDTIDTWDGQVDHVDGGPGRDHAYYDRTLDKRSEEH